MNVIAYYRVSTQKQGASGLGLDSQRQIVSQYAKSVQGEVVEEFTEVESGTKKGKRVEIYRALARCKEIGATLIVAKLDRLARDTQFVLSIHSSGVDIVFCDFPYANRMVITILSAIAEYEAKLISERTTKALDQISRKIIETGSYTSKAGNVVTKMGNPRAAEIIHHATAASVAAREKLVTPNKELGGIIEALISGGHTYGEVAAALNEGGSKTTTGKVFTTSICWGIHKRYKLQSEKKKQLAAYA